MLANNVKIKLRFWECVPWIGKYTAQAIYPNIYISSKVYNDLKSNNPDPRSVAVLIHEETHIKRQKEAGWLRWGVKYFLFPKFRFAEELVATKASMKYLKKQSLDVDLERKARVLSGWLYFWPVSYEYAKKELDGVWSQVGGRS